MSVQPSPSSRSRRRSSRSGPSRLRYPTPRRRRGNGRRPRCGRAGSSVGRPLGPQFTGMPFHRQLSPGPAPAWSAGPGRDSSRRTGRASRHGRSRGRCNPSPSASRGEEARFRRHVLKAAMIVPVQDVLAVVGDEEIGPAVVVPVAGADRGRPASAAQAGGVGRVREASRRPRSGRGGSSGPRPRASTVRRLPSSRRVPESTRASSLPSLS